MLARCLFIVLTLLSVGVSAQEVGKAAPSFEVTTAAKPVRLADLKGRVVYLDFWASWCAPCKQSFPFMNDMLAKYGQRGLTIVAVTVDRKREDADKFLAATPANFLIGYDSEGKVAELYRPQGMPTSYLIGADGKVRVIHVGFRENDRDTVEREIQAALNAAGRR